MNRKSLMPHFAALLCLLLVTLPARAQISEPEYLVFGDIILEEVLITAAETQYTVEATFEGETVAEYTMGDDPSIGDRYLLTFPMDSMGERSPGHQRVGDELLIFFRDNGELITVTSIVIMERGTALTLDAVDTDGNGTFDFNDPDDDNDLVLDEDDNCRLIYNPGQEDFDNDGIGDVCDDDDDNDDVPDELDDLPFNADESVDTDGDGVGDNSDNCVDIANSLQQDLDGDNIGNICDPDQDEDGFDNEFDNCPADVNPGQEDLDGDGVGDLCEPICAPLGRGSRLNLVCF